MNNKLAFYITSTGWGGLEMNTLKLANLLKMNGYSISLFSQYNSLILKNSISVFQREIYIERGRKYFDFKNAKIIANHLNEENIGIIFVFDNRDLEVIAYAKRFYYPKLKIIYQQHMQMGVVKKDLFHTFRYRSIDAWISPLEHLKNEVINFTRFPAERIHIIPLCLDITKFIHNKYEKNKARDLLNINPQFPLFGIIGRITEKKGQLFLIESLLKMRSENINFEILIFGSATVNDEPSQIYYKSILDLIKSNDLQDRVHLVDFNEDVSLFYNSVDLFVLASESETYGMVTIEAMLSGLPIVATNNGGTPEILGFGKFGKLFKYNDFDSLKESILWHLENKEDSLQMAKNAKKEAIEKYRIENEINQIDLLIQNLRNK